MSLSVREYDRDGRLRIVMARISKACVSPYKGHEIPHLGLDPDRTYMLLRDPDELRRAAPSFNKVPILETHEPVSADNHPFDIVAGATGSDCRFDGTYLTNSLAIWTRSAIDGVESGRRRELSAAYRFVADMTPGRFMGQRFDGVMREISGNHVALVDRGRVGADVVVGDVAMDAGQVAAARQAWLIREREKGRQYAAEFLQFERALSAIRN